MIQSQVENDVFIRLPVNGLLIHVLTEGAYPTHAIRLLSQHFKDASLRVTDCAEVTHIDKCTGLIIQLTETVSIQSELSWQEGAFLIKTEKLYGYPALQIRGCGTAGVIYAVNELLQQQLKRVDDSWVIPVLNLTQTPALPYRLFWTWDHSTNWYLNQNGQQDIGFANPYLKPEMGFLEDYKRLVDFMSLNRINGVTIYGFLRDTHGGIEAAQEICRYANERGVRIFQEWGLILMVGSIGKGAIVIIYHNG